MRGNFRTDPTQAQATPENPLGTPVSRLEHRMKTANREIGVPRLEIYCSGVAGVAGADASFGPKFLARY
jgi:hypothetical protein